MGVGDAGRAEEDRTGQEEGFHDYTVASTLERYVYDIANEWLIIASWLIAFRLRIETVQSEQSWEIMCAGL